MPTKLIVEPTAALRPYQGQAVAHLLRKPASGLLMPPGTGKTLSTLAAYWILRRKKFVDRLLVMAPLRPCYSVWPQEVVKWGFGFSTLILHGDRKDTLIYQAADYDINIINYDGLMWLNDNWKIFKGRKKDVRIWLVMDESTKIKHTNTQRYKILKPLLSQFTRRTILTGTPSPNGLRDLFGQVYAVDLGERFGSYITHYLREYFYPVGFGGFKWVPQEDAEKRIYKKLDGLFFRVSESVLKLPKLLTNQIIVDLPAKAMKLYKRLETEFIAEINDVTLTAANAGVLSSKLRQVANGILYDGEHCAHAIHDAKVDALTDLVEELQGDPLFVGYEFTADAERLQKVFKKMGIKAPIVGGGMTPKKSDTIFSEFNKGEHPVLLCQSDAVAHGLNLQERCHTIARFGLTWNLETDIQFAKRVHRSGQKRTVIDHRITARDTIDEIMWLVLRKKNADQNALLDAIKRRYV